MKERGGFVVVRAILATMAVLLVTRHDLAAVDLYALCLNYLRAWLGF